MSAQGTAGSSKSDPKSGSGSDAQIRKEEREPTATELTLLRFAWEGAIAVDQLCELMELDMASMVELLIGLDELAWVAVGQIVDDGYPMVWLRRPGAQLVKYRHENGHFEGRRPKAHELPYLRALNAARIRLAKEYPEGRWICGEVLANDFRASYDRWIPAAVLECKEEGLISHRAVDVAWAASAGDLIPDPEWIAEVLVAHAARYDAVDYFCSGTVRQLCLRMGLEAQFPTLRIQELPQFAYDPDDEERSLLEELRERVNPRRATNLIRIGQKSGERRPLRVQGPMVVYRVSNESVPPKALQEVAKDAGLSAPPKLIAAWKQNNGGVQVYCLETSVGVYRAAGSPRWGWRVDKIDDESVFVKKEHLPGPPKVESKGEDEISDAAWRRIKPLLPPVNRPGPYKDANRSAVCAIVCMLRHHLSSWNDLSHVPGFGSGSRCNRALRRWEACGVWPQVRQILEEELHDGHELNWPRLEPGKGGPRVRRPDDV